MLDTRWNLEASLNNILVSLRRYLTVVASGMLSLIQPDI